MADKVERRKRHKEERRNVCRHRTKSGCSLCGCCFACCVCWRVADYIFKLAQRVRKNGEWFVGGYMGAVEEQWERNREQRERMGRKGL